MEQKKLTVITGTVGQDSHIIGVSFLSRFLKQNGFDVVELRGLTPPEDFINAAKETDAVAILISSLYGMGGMDLVRFKDKCTEAGLDDVLLYVGGYLKIGRHDWKESEKRFSSHLKLRILRLRLPKDCLEHPLNPSSSFQKLS